MASELVTLGGGCFWCLEAAFQRLRGVRALLSGYAGGDDRRVSYEDVCTGTTGHAEVVQVTFENAEIAFETLLGVFFTIHDPTTLNRQGADLGSQYRSVIYHHSDAQRQTAERVMAELDASGIWSAPIVTELAPVPTFHPAEAYHQDYFRRHPTQGYCLAVIAPKLAKLRAQHASLLDSP